MLVNEAKTDEFWVKQSHVQRPRHHRKSITCLSAKGSSIKLAFRIEGNDGGNGNISVGVCFLLYTAPTFCSLLTKPPITSTGPGIYGQLENK